MKKERKPRRKDQTNKYISKVIEADDIKRRPKKAKTEVTPEEDPMKHGLPKSDDPIKMSEDTPVDPDDNLGEEVESPIQPCNGGEDPVTGRRVRRRKINVLEGGSQSRDNEERR